MDSDTGSSDSDADASDTGSCTESDTGWSFCNSIFLSAKQSLHQMTSIIKLMTWECGYINMPKKLFFFYSILCKNLKDCNTLLDFILIFEIANFNRL